METVEIKVVGATLERMKELKKAGKNRIGEICTKYALVGPAFYKPHWDYEYNTRVFYKERMGF